MFGKAKDNPTEAQPSTFTCAAVTRLASRDLGVSSISSSITIVGKISGKGTVRISGRIEGELYASTVLIDDGAQVEGDIFAEELSSRAEEFHLRALPDTYVNLSIHTAPDVRPLP